MEEPVHDKSSLFCMYLHHVFTISEPTLILGKDCAPSIRNLLTQSQYISYCLTKLLSEELETTCIYVYIYINILLFSLIISCFQQSNTIKNKFILQSLCKLFTLDDHVSASSVVVSQYPPTVLTGVRFPGCAIFYFTSRQ